MAQKDLTAPTSSTGTDTQVVTGTKRGTKFGLDFANISENEITYIDEASSTVTYVGAAAVWDALATEFNNAGTMGEKLNDAGSAGNPWAALLVDNTTAGTFGERVQKLLTTAKFLGLK